MSIDRRLRRDLERDAGRIEVDVDRNLGAVEARARHRGPFSLVPVLAAAALIVVAFTLRLAPAPNSGTPTPAPTSSGTTAPTSPDYAAIAGTYRVSLEAGLEVDDVTGTWTMQLSEDGEVLLTPPASFAGPSLTPTGIGFALDGDRFRTDLFYNDYCRSVGAYSWTRGAGHLTLAPVDEDCPIRRALLSTTPWTELP